MNSQYPQQTRSTIIPIQHSPPKRRSGNSVEMSDTGSASLSYQDDLESKYDKKWYGNKLNKTQGVIVVVIMFLLFAIIVYTRLPAAESPFNPQNITQNQQHSTINNIISPRFNVDQSMTNKIPQINPIHPFHQSSSANNILPTSKTGIVYFLEETATQNEFCDLLSSVASTISSTTSLEQNKIEIIVFMHYTFAIEKIDLELLATKMNFKLLKYELNGSVMMEHIIRKLQSLEFDAIIYLDYHTFALQDLSVLFQSISIEKYHFGAIWSFEKGFNDRYVQCLLPSMFIINIKHITKYNINYIQIFKDQTFCSALVGHNNAVSIDAALNKITEISKQYGIVSLPWWYVMDHNQFKMYYAEINERSANHEDAVSWLEYMDLFQSKIHSKPIPMLIDITHLNTVTYDPFWSEWTSKRQKSIELCQNIAS